MAVRMDWKWDHLMVMEFSLFIGRVRTLSLFSVSPFLSVWLILVS
jgi:hypothetical protein